MSRSLSFQWIALSRVAVNLVLGLVPFGLMAALHPSVTMKVAAPVWFCLVVSLAIAGATSETLFVGVGNVSINIHRALASLLLGSSFAAVPWKLHDSPFALGVILTGLGLRWLLYALEAWELRIADLRKQPLPCLATRIRRGITLVTGGLIPLLILIGLPVMPLLTFSFILTVFSQWTVACESCHAAARSIP